MRTLICFFLALSFLSLLACNPDSSTSSRKPIGPTSEESDMPWNRPTGPEGAGALGILNQQ